MTMKSTMKFLLSIQAIVAMANFVVGCPTYCNCESGYKVTCNGIPVTSLKMISDDIPSGTSIFEIRGGLFYSIDEGDIQPLASTQLTELKITHGQLREIHNNAFITLTSLRELNLQSNQVSSIQQHALKGLNNLQSIDLSENRLGDIPNTIFSYQTILRTLNIAGNKNINNLRGPSFQGLNNLKTLLASNCGIRTFESDFFSAVHSVVELDLSNNEIQSLPNSDSLKQMRNLRNLTLQGNRISTLMDGQFAEMDLDILDLSNNAISSLPPNVFLYLRVRNLDLSGNRIQTLPEYIFQPISSELKSLKLNNNPQLETLPAKIFQGMTKMQVLNISNCALKSVNDDLFQQIFLLQEIDLSNNRLKYISESFLEKTSYMQTVGLSNNNWHCSCEIIPFRNWLRYPYASSKLYCGPYSAAGYNINCPQPRCASPSQLMHREISMLSDEELGKCENNIGESTTLSVNTLAGIIAGVLLVLVIVIVIIVCCVHRRKKRGDRLPCYNPDNELEDKKRREKIKAKEKKAKEKKAKEKAKERAKKGYYDEKKEKRNNIDPEAGSFSESDKSFVVRHFFSSMNPNPDEASDEEASQSMVRKDSQESLSQSAYGYHSRHGSRHSSQYSLNAGIKIESAV